VLTLLPTSTKSKWSEKYGENRGKAREITCVTVEVVNTMK